MSDYSNLFVFNKSFIIADVTVSQVRSAHPGMTSGGPNTMKVISFIKDLYSPKTLDYYLFFYCYLSLLSIK